MASVNQEVQIGSIHGSSFRPYMWFMGYKHYQARPPPLFTKRKHAGICMDNVQDSDLRCTTLYNGVTLSVDRQPNTSRIKLLDRFLETTTYTLQLNNTCVQDFIVLRDLPNQSEQGNVILSQSATPKHPGPRRYG
jgi:hypothetical protein